MMGVALSFLTGRRLWPGDRGGHGLSICRCGPRALAQSLVLLSDPGQGTKLKLAIRGTADAGHA